MCDIQHLFLGRNKTLLIVLVVNIFATINLFNIYYNFFY